MSIKKPELVAPAGDMEKAEAAFLYGADAVYVGGKEFSLRAQAGNFSDEEMVRLVDMARARGKRVYVAVNILAHNRDLDRLPAYLALLQELKVDGIILTDPGVLELAGKYAPDVPITISTQASVANVLAARFYESLGVKRIVLARELTLEEMREIRENVRVELEVFVHGAMCVAYSGRCLLSSFMTGRSSNRGECAHPCRYQYFLREEKRPGEYFPIEEDDRGTYILNSKDLCLIEHIPELVEMGIDALKIEGRMKSPHYVATAAQVYRQAVEAAVNGCPGRDVAKWKEELNKIANRPYTTGFLFGPPIDGQDVFKEFRPPGVAFCGIVRDYRSDKSLALIEQRAPFGVGDVIEFLQPRRGLYRMRVEEMFDTEMCRVDRARHAQQLLWLPVGEEVEYFAIVRRYEPGCGMNEIEGPLFRPRRCYGEKGEANKIYLRLDPENIDFLNRIIEGCDGLGILSTVDNRQGQVVIRVTPDTRRDILEILEHLPFAVQIVSEPDGHRYS